MSETITIQGRTYQIGSGHHVPCLLPEWFPPQLTVSWRETIERRGPGRGAGRAG